MTPTPTYRAYAPDSAKEPLGVTAAAACTAFADRYGRPARVLVVRGPLGPKDADALGRLGPVLQESTGPARPPQGVIWLLCPEQADQGTLGWEGTL